MRSYSGLGILSLISPRIPRKRGDLGLRRVSIIPVRFFFMDAFRPFPCCFYYHDHWAALAGTYLPGLPNYKLLQNLKLWYLVSFFNIVAVDT